MRREAEPALIAQARHDRAAFAALYDLYVTRVYAFCAVHSTSREDAEDLTAQGGHGGLLVLLGDNCGATCG
jgi:hypothetical protein